MKQFEMKQKKNGGFLSMLLGTLGSSLWRNVLTGKGINQARGGTNNHSQNIWD